mgnify:CR=1 FL=1
MSIDTNETSDSAGEDYLDMSDEDFERLGDPQLLPPGDDIADAGDEDTDLDDSDDETDDTDSTDDVDTETTDEAEGDESGDDEDGEDQYSDTDTDSDDETDEDADEDDEAGDDKEDKDEASVDYEAEYKKMLAPFKANGKNMTVENIDDMRKLAQMGANYNKKMAAMKPSMKVLKMLEKADLLEGDKLNFLIDLHKGDPDAIKKLVRDSKIDTDTLSMDEELNDYKPSDNSVADKEVELDTVIDSIKDTESYTRTLKVVGSEWDDSSKRIVADQPDLIRVINDQIASGVFDRISNEVEKERVFGRLEGISDIEAYRLQGEKMEAAGEFKDAEQAPTDDASEKAAAAKLVKKTKDAERIAKRKALKGTKRLSSKPGKRNDKDFSPLNLSDADFEKEFDSNLL